MTQLIHPNNVVLSTNTSTSSIRRMMDVLTRQGQIEPLQVYAIHDLDGTVLYLPFEQDAWGKEIVEAARRLGWDTILVHVTDRYEH